MGHGSCQKDRIPLPLFQFKASKRKVRVFLTETKKNTATDLGFVRNVGGLPVDFRNGDDGQTDDLDRIGSTSNSGQPHPTKVEPSNTKRLGHFATLKTSKPRDEKRVPSIGNENTYPSKREVRKIIDSTLTFQGDMLVPRGYILPQEIADFFVPYKSDIFRKLSATWWYQAAGSKLLVIHQGLEAWIYNPVLAWNGWFFMGSMFVGTWNPKANHL